MAPLHIFCLSCVFLFSENPLKTNGLKIALRLARSVCNQMAKYEDDCELTPPEKKPDPNLPEICGSAKWTKCDGSSCKPFKIIASGGCEGGGGGGGNRHERVEVMGNSYPSVAGVLEFLLEEPNYIMNGFLIGHAFFINPTTLLTTGISGKNTFIALSRTYSYRLVAGDLSLSNYNKGDIKISKITLHPEFNEKTLENNVALIHLANPVTFNDKIKNISLKAAGGKCSGKVKFASWTKMRIGGKDSHHWNYHDKMHEIKSSLNMAKPEELAKSPCIKSAVCTSPLLCGLWDQGSPLICSEGSTEYAYAIASHYFVDMDIAGEICGGYSTFVTLDDVLDWIQENSN